MTLSNKVYDITKSIALLWLPALGTLYAALSPIWHLPNTAGVEATIVAADTFLGGILRLSSSGFSASQPATPTDGSLTIDKASGKLTINVDSLDDIDTLAKKTSVTLAVVEASAPASA